MVFHGDFPLYSRAFPGLRQDCRYRFGADIINRNTIAFLTYRIYRYFLCPAMTGLSGSSGIVGRTDRQPACRASCPVPPSRVQDSPQSEGRPAPWSLPGTENPFLESNDRKFLSPVRTLSRQKKMSNTRQNRIIPWLDKSKRRPPFRDSRDIREWGQAL